MECGNPIVFEKGVRLARENGIGDNVVMCGKCRSVWAVHLVPGRMTLTENVTGNYSIRRQPTNMKKSRPGISGKYSAPVETIDKRERWIYLLSWFFLILSPSLCSIDLHTFIRSMETIENIYRGMAALLFPVLSAILVTGLIKPNLVLRWSSRPTRLKVLGWWIPSLFLYLLTVAATIEIMDTMKTPAEIIRSSEKDIEKGRYEDAANRLKRITPEDSLYEKAQSVILQANDLIRSKNAPGTAIAFLDKIPDATPVTDDENKIGLSIKNVSKIDSGVFEISWKNTYKLTADNRQTERFMEFFIGLQLFFIDPENYENNYQNFTIDENKKILFTYHEGEEIGALSRCIQFEPPSKVVYLYFPGIKSEDGYPPELSTAPLFFTIALGEKPYLLEETPRHANKLFDEAIKTKKEVLSGLDMMNPSSVTDFFNKKR
ncbi:MAG: hypothetical protein LBC47_07345 [Tannerella sp.]|nr:hypothetical protein [Tannerella sp.]